MTLRAPTSMRVGAAGAMCHEESESVIRRVWRRFGEGSLTQERKNVMGGFGTRPIKCSTGASTSKACRSSRPARKASPVDQTPDLVSAIPLVSFAVLVVVSPPVSCAPCLRTWIGVVKEDWRAFWPHDAGMSRMSCY